MLAVALATGTNACTGGAVLERPKAAADPAPPPAETTVACASVLEARTGRACAIPLDDKALAHRLRSSVLHFVGGKLARVDVVNGSGGLVDGDAAVATWEPRYEGDRVFEDVGRSTTGRVVLKMRWSNGARQLDYLDEHDRPRPLAKTRVVRELRDYDAQGHYVSRRFLDENGKPTPSRFGAFELRQVRDARGSIVEQTSFDATGHAMRDERGVHRYVFTLDALGDGVEARAFGLDGGPVDDALDGAVVRRSFDTWGNVLDARWEDVDGKPYVSGFGAERATWSYDDGGGLIENRLLYADGRPFEKVPCSTLHYTLDAQGRTSSTECLDATGRKSTKGDTWLAVRDDKGRLIEQRFFFASGDAATPGRWTTRRNRVDDRDRIVERRYFDAKGAPANGNLGVHIERTSYDELDREVERTFFDASEQPAATKLGVARVVTTYGADGRGRATSYDASGAPAGVFSASHILVRYQGAYRAAPDVTRAKEQARARAAWIHARVAAGFPFGLAVALYSDEPGAAARGGDMGTTKVGVQVASLDAAIRELELGGISDVVESDYGFHVIRRSQ